MNYANSPDPTLQPLGLVKFSQNSQTYYTYGRLDAAVTKKLRLYGSWLYQLQKLTGEVLPFPDSANGEFNISSSVAPSGFSHGLGYTAPNSTTNVGADYNINSRLVLTGRYGYYFENYHDFGFPEIGTLTNFTANGQGAVDAFGAPLPDVYQKPGGFFNIANSPNFTTHNASKASQVDVDLAWYKSGWKGIANNL